MFEKTPLLSLQVLTISNYLKGGDFMERLARQVALDSRKDPTHPLVSGRTRFDSALELLEQVRLRDKRDQFTTDWSLFNAAREMDAVSDRG